MVSYRTLIFGTIAVISASAPALAAGPKAQPSQTQITYAGPKAQPSAQTDAGPKAQPSQTDSGPKAQPGGNDVITLLLKGFGDLQNRILQIHL